ncbi:MULTISPECIES: glycosyltransferase family 2 protein [unclassified Rhizobium]
MLVAMFSVTAPNWFHARDQYVTYATSNYNTENPMHRTCHRPKISGVIVSYNPNIEVLGHLLDAVTPQVDELILIDNGSRTDLRHSFGDKATTELVMLGDNYGIARAQNIGIDKARTGGADFVLLLDQDSIPEKDMVANLLAAILAKQQEGFRVACAGPRYHDDRHNNSTPFVRLEGYRITRLACSTSAGIIDVDFVIASGCLIPMTTIDAVGSMKEEMFIDYVDIEWGLRAQKKGYSSYGVCAAGMKHALGDNSVAFGKHQIPTHSPLRHYYHIRNAVWLCRQPWLKSNWKVALLWRVARQLVFFSVMTPPRFQHAWMMVGGAVHGIVNRMGRR